jgi:hypothetical protein
MDKQERPIPACQAELIEYNRTHGPDGRFASSKGSSGGDKFAGPSKVDKFAGPSGGSGGRAHDRLAAAGGDRQSLRTNEWESAMTRATRGDSISVTRDGKTISGTVTSTTSDRGQGKGVVVKAADGSEHKFSAFQYDFAATPAVKLAGPRHTTSERLLQTKLFDGAGKTSRDATTPARVTALKSAFKAAESSERLRRVSMKSGPSGATSVYFHPSSGAYVQTTSTSKSFKIEQMPD